MKLLWITNIATPYTVPVWRELTKLSQFHVVCMADIEPNRHWEVDVTDVPLTVLHARSVRAGVERILYAPTLRMFALFHEQKPDVVVLDGWESPAFWQARLLARRAGARVLLSYWSTAATHRFSRGPVAAFRRRFFLSADGVITPGEAAFNAVTAMGVPPNRIVTSIGTVDVQQFAAIARMAHDSSPKHSGHRFLFVGQLIPRKNVGALLEAFASIRGAQDTLTLVGSGPLENSLRTVANDLAPDAVTFCGHLDGDDLFEAYAAADTLVLPSTQDVYGLVANEALAAGLTVVISDACGVTPLIRHMPRVLTTAPDAESIAVAMKASDGLRAGEHQSQNPEGHPILNITPELTAMRIAKMASAAHTRHD